MTLRFLADASCDFNVVKALRKAGFQMDAVAEIAANASDDKIMDMATKGRSVLITEDKDFGWLVYAKGHDTVGILFLRYKLSARSRLIQQLIQFIQKTGEDLIGAFVVAQPGRFRIRKLLNQGLNQGPTKN
jgi:predicted nuclease of predicted toxin-antitoxin system